MNQTISKMIYIGCLHKNDIIRSGKLICQDCGLELNEVFSTPRVVLAGDVNGRIRGNSAQYIGAASRSGFIGKTGSEIGSNSRTIRDNIKYNRLRSMNKNIINNGAQKRIISLMIINKICRSLCLPKYIINDSALRFRKIDKSGIHIVNRVSCVYYCIWDSIRHFGYHTHLSNLIKTFRNYGHRVGKKGLIRDAGIYREILYNKGIKKTNSKSLKDYITSNIGILNSNFEYIKEMLKQKGFIIKVEKYLFELETLSFEIEKKVRRYFSYRGNPFSNAGACVYFAALLISKRHKKKKILTQAWMGEILEIPSYTIRDVFIHHLKQFVIKK